MPPTQALAPPADAVLAMLQAATEKGFTADQIEQLVRLKTHIDADEARKAFSTAMVACQTEMPVVLKDGMNNHTKKSYARLETMTAMIKPVYTRHGFALSFGQLGTTQSPFGKVNRPDGSSEELNCTMFRVYCDVRHRGGHCERYEADIPLDGIGPKGESIGGMNRTQAGGSTYSYAQRYIQKLIFNLTIADEDQDGVGRNEYITAEQVGELNELLIAARMADAKGREGFKAWVYDNCKATDFIGIPAKAWPTVRGFLEKRVKAAQNGGAK